MELPEGSLRKVLTLKDVETQDFETAYREGMANPLDSPTLEDFLRGCKELLIIVNDGTRPTPTAEILKKLHPIIRDMDFRIIVATGSHRTPTSEEYDFIFGDLYLELKDRILVHDARDQKQLGFVGTTPAKTPVFYNKAVLTADRIITINSVEPHYFAGYTGGRKSFLPGVAGFETIETNHAHALSGKAKTLALKGNPVNDDMEEAAALAGKPVFSMQTVLDGEKNLYKLVTGELTRSFYKAVEYANDLFTTPFDRKLKIVLSVAPYPMDLNLYQAQKAIENGKLALEEGGILILVARCKKGIGPAAFFDLLKSRPSCREIMDELEHSYVLGYHKAGKIAEMNLWAEIWTITDIDDETIREAKMVPKSSLQEAVDQALEKMGPQTQLYYLPNGSMTVPIRRER